MPMRAQTIAVASGAAQIHMGEEPAIMKAIESATLRLQRVTGWQTANMAEIIPMARTGDAQKFIVRWTK